MRKLKYIEPITRISLLFIWIAYFSKLEKIPLLFIVLALSTDLLIKLIRYLWIKNQIEKSKLIYFNRKISLFRKISNLISLVIFAYFIIFITVAIINETISLNTFGVISITYIGIYDILFFNKIRRIYVDKYGIIRGNLNESTIKWDKIEDFKITKETIEIETSKSNYSITLTPNESKKIIDFIKKQKIKVPNTYETNC